MSTFVKPTVLTLFGPTASGKTALAIFLAQKFNGVVINADSRQLYKRMPIITAMPSADEFAQAEHLLFEVLEANEKISVTQYVAMVKQAVAQVVAQGKLPILCGGTGFYLKALMEGMSDIPSTESSVLSALESEFPEDAPQRLWDAVNLVDAASAQNLNVNDRQRLLRALCVHRQTGKALSYYQSLPKTGALDARFIALALCPERDVLRERIGRRFDMMIDAGLVDEMQNLKSMGYQQKDPGIQSVGVAEFFQYLDGEKTLDEVAALTVNQTRQYAKRQVTWLRGQYPADFVFENMQDAQNNLSVIEEML